MSRPLSDVLEIVDRSIFEAIYQKAVTEGYTVDRSVAGILADEVAWKASEDVIIADKGFVIDIFGSSNAHKKERKEVPRITYIPERLLPGNIGNSPAFRYEEVEAGYTKLIDPNQTSDYLFKIGISAKSPAQWRLLHSIIAASIPHREFIEVYNDPTEHFLITQYGYQDDPDLTKGTMDGYYLYKAVDLYEHMPKVIDNAIAKINNIKVEESGDNLLDLS